MCSRTLHSGCRPAWLSALSLVLMLSASAASIDAALAQEGQSAAAQRSFSIPAGSLSAALVVFGQQAGVQVSYVPSVASGLKSSGVNGIMSVDAALSQLLSGTGLSFKMNGAKTVVVSQEGDSAGATVDGAIALDTIDVSGGASAAEAAADAPYQAAGSVSHVSREQIDRVPPISPGDMFINTPGVINAGNRVGTSLNPNIRGLQGMGRVNTTIDGARQNTSSYRGYIGNRDESYVDPDMIGGIDISKGPSSGPGVGGIGGTVNFRTLEAGDIVKPGETKGSRVKTMLGSNGVSPPAEGTTATADRPTFYGDTFSGSFATAVAKENYEGIVAYSKRQQGNYFAGTDVPKGLIVEPPKPTDQIRSQIMPGYEVFNTSEDTDSFLAKGKLKGEEQSLELSYLYYGSKAAQINDIFITTGSPNTQYDPPETRVDTYTAKYRYTPTDNPYVRFRANLWLTDLYSDKFLGNFPFPYASSTVGGDIGNTSVVDTSLGELTLDAGAEFVREHATAEQFASPVTGSKGWETYGPSGVRLMTSAYGSASLKPTDWMTLTGGLRFDHYTSEGEGYLAKYPDKSGSRASPNASILIEPLDGVQLYAQYAEGYRPPSLRESHWHYQGLLVNNPNLEGEVAYNKEVGLNLLRNDVAASGDKLRFKASYFDNFYDDYIIRYLKPARPGQMGNEYHWANIDSATYRGFELSGGYDVRWLFVEGAFTKYTNVEYCLTRTNCGAPKYGTVLSGGTSPTAADYASNYVPPDYSGSVTLGIRAFDEKLTLGARTHFAGLRYGSEWATVSAARIGIESTWPKYQIYDVFGSYQLTDDAIVNFSVENITDEYYFGGLASLGIPSPGRTVRLGFTRNLDGDAFPEVPDLTLGRAAEGTPGSNWTGLYFGGHVGYGFAGTEGVTTAADGTPGGIPATESVSLHGKDLPRGGQIGVNYQMPNRVVIGAEADFSWSTFTGNQKAASTESATLTAGSWPQAETDYAFDWMATLRGRVGYAYDRFLIFGTGGLAFLNEEQTRTQYISNGTASASNPIGRYTEESFKESSSAVRMGWTAGVGAEYALTSNWSLKAEYQFADFGQETFLFPGARAGVVKGFDTTTICRVNSPPPCPGGVNTVIRTHTTGSSEITNGRKALNELELQTLKLGVNYRF